MDMQELRQRLMVVFIEELHECVGDMDRHLQSLLQNQEPQVREMLKNELYRAAHKMKGAANAAQVPSIEQLCRQMQDILISIRDGQRTMDETLHSQFTKAVTFLRAAEALLRNGETPPSSDSIFD
jgi:two-component system chemotaxis sensor kinase CheA